TGGSGGAHRTHTFRADVFQFLPIDANGKVQANGAHAITLPDAGTGNQVPSSAGASLVVIYRDPSKPLTSIVIYDGSYSMDNSTQRMDQRIRGFYQASTGAPAAKLTHIVGDGSPNKTERLLFATGVTAPNIAANFVQDNPFQGLASPSADPAWDNPT